MVLELLPLLLQLDYPILIVLLKTSEALDGLVLGDILVDDPVHTMCSCGIIQLFEPFLHVEDLSLYF